MCCVCQPQIRKLGTDDPSASAEKERTKKKVVAFERENSMLLTKNVIATREEQEVKSASGP